MKYYYGAELYGRRGKSGKLRDAIIDGDTIDVLCDCGFGVRLAMRLRLAGIDTPESRTRNKEEKALGLASKAFLREALESAASIEFLSHERGKYGRVLATVYAIDDDGNRRNINAALVEAGHARRYDGGKREPWT